MNEVVHLMAKLIHRLKQANQTEFALKLEEIREELIMSLVD